MQKFKRIIANYLPLFLLLVFAAVQYILIFRHKSPYLSDSYFYKHIYYEIKGADYETAKSKVASQINLAGADDLRLDDQEATILAIKKVMPAGNTRITGVLQADSGKSGRRSRFVRFGQIFTG